MEPRELEEPTAGRGPRAADSGYTPLNSPTQTPSHLFCTPRSPLLLRPRAEPTVDALSFLPPGPQ